MIEDVRVGRGMPWLKRGMRIDMNGKKGRVTGGGAGCNIRVRFDGEKCTRYCHPQWQTTYYDGQGNVIADYKADTLLNREPKRYIVEHGGCHGC